VLDAPGNNIAGETYGAGSRCIEHGQNWIRTTGGVQVDTYDIGVGCYQVSKYYHHSSIRKIEPPAVHIHW
jgi:hypothetical protein